MLLSRQALTLGGKLSQTTADAETSIAWLDDIIDVAILCSLIWISELVCVFLLLLSQECLYILASTLLADGIITPAITVTTAIEGLESISPHLPVIPITLGIITIIFFVQRFGTESIGKSFGVFMLIWFLLLGVTGAFSITSYPLILKAFNPYYAAMLLAKSPEWSFILRCSGQNPEDHIR